MKQQVIRTIRRNAIWLDSGKQTVKEDVQQQFFGTLPSGNYRVRCRLHPDGEFVVVAAEYVQLVWWNHAYGGHAAPGFACFLPVEWNGKRVNRTVLP